MSSSRRNPDDDPSEDRGEGDESGWIDEDEDDDQPATTVYARLQPSGNIAFSLDEDDDYVPYDEQDIESDEEEEEEEDDDDVSDDDAFDLIAGGRADENEAMPGAFPRRSARVGGGGGGAGPGVDGLAGEQAAEMSPLRMLLAHMIESDLSARENNPQSGSGAATQQASAPAGGARQFMIPANILRALLESGSISADGLSELASALQPVGAGNDEESEDEADEGMYDDDDDDDDGGAMAGLFRRRAAAAGMSQFDPVTGRQRGWEWFEIEKEGKEQGRRLARSGNFGKALYPSSWEMRARLEGDGGGAGEADDEDDDDLDDSTAMSSPQQPSTSGSSSRKRTNSGLSMTSTSRAAASPKKGRRGETSRDMSSSALSTSPVDRKVDLSSGAEDYRLPSNRRRSSSSNNAAQPKLLRRGSSISSIRSDVSGISGDDRVKGIKSRMIGRGNWTEGRKGWGRELQRGVWGASGREEWHRHCIPNSNGTIVATYADSPYIGQHSHDYSFFYTATQDFQLHLYSTQRAPLRGPTRPRAAQRPRRLYVRDDDDEAHSMQKIKTVQGVTGSWTVTDCDLTRDNQWMIYSTINPLVHLLRTSEHEDEHQQLNFAVTDRNDRMHRYGHFGIWSVRWSADQSEIVAGASSGQIMVYDVESKRRVLNIDAHADDVNGVCFADQDSTNVIISASDDGYLKVWDRRSLSSEVPSGVLVGHTEGLTYVSPKGDGRYVISNGKDQAIRLWDLRNMRQWKDVADHPDACVTYGLGHGFDYRNGTYRKPRYTAHPKDCSVMTYRGHRVLRTLIRCHFSPTETTGGQYIYTGGANGVIYIYALDGRVVQVLDRTKSTGLRRGDGQYNDPSAPVATPEYDPDPRGSMGTIVRDVSWNGLEPSMISTAWERSHTYGGSVAVHEWRGLGKGGLNKLEDWVEMNAT